MQCYAPSLHEVCVAVTLNDHNIFDMEEYLRQYSRAIYPLFVWNIWYYRTPHYSEFTLTDFLRIIEPGSFSLANPWEPISRVKQKAEKKVAQLWRIHPNEKKSYHQVEASLTELGVTPDNTYMYIQGHHLFDKVVVPMLSKVCEKACTAPNAATSSRVTPTAWPTSPPCSRKTPVSCAPHNTIRSKEISTLLYKAAIRWATVCQTTSRRINETKNKHYFPLIFPTFAVPLQYEHAKYPKRKT